MDTVPILKIMVLLNAEGSRLVRCPEWRQNMQNQKVCAI
ncbi:hypothetical protein ykris0001_6880 [Yersinia kristensenii ATCC 33638]|nr:hypothetical protein ykris0001_6880 [Yersinia kristensenii ATCC 33638]